MKNSQDTSYQNQLETIISDNPNSIESAVAQTAFEYLEDDDIYNFFQNLLQYGCISGMISELVYYCDTHAFYDAHYAHIEEVRRAYEHETGTPIHTKNDYKNHRAWFAYEYVAYQMAQKLGVW